MKKAIKKKGKKIGYISLNEADVLIKPGVYNDLDTGANYTVPLAEEYTNGGGGGSMPIDPLAEPPIQNNFSGDIQTNDQPNNFYQEPQIQMPPANQPPTLYNNEPPAMEVVEKKLNWPLLIILGLGIYLLSKKGN